jgi:hypothetical protein
MGDEVKDTIYKHYKDKNYTKACKEAVKHYRSYKKTDTDFFSLMGFSCLYADNIYRLDIAIKKLVSDKKARANALYFVTIKYQKKMLYNALVDGLDISSINLPKTNYILSTIFDKYVKKDYAQKGNTYIFTDKKLTYELSVIDRKTVPKLLLVTKKGKKVIKKRRYW